MRTAVWIAVGFLAGVFYAGYRSSKWQSTEQYQPAAPSLSETSA